MRWNIPVYGERRTVTKFLWFPLEINKEVRWLEKATYIEEYDRFYLGGEYYYMDWNPIKWVDNGDDKK